MSRYWKQALRSRPLVGSSSSSVSGSLISARPSRNQRCSAVVGAELLIRPGVRARIVARQDDAQAAHVAPILVLKVVRDDAEVGPQVEDVPALLAEDAYGTALALDGIDVARQQLEQGRFAGAVGSKDGGLASDCDVERQVVEDASAAAIGADVLDLDDVLHGCRSYLDCEYAAAVRAIMEAPYPPNRRPAVPGR